MPAPHERLEACEAAHPLTLAVYRATDGFPPSERYGITSQLRRAAVAIPANLADGSAKRGRREWRRFLDIALGSIGELTYLLRLARDLGYLTPEHWTQLEAARDRVGKLVWGLYRVVGRRIFEAAGRQNSACRSTTVLLYDLLGC
jgi:four helix bundle protein